MIYFRLSALLSGRDVMIGNKRVCLSSSPELIGFAKQLLAKKLVVSLIEQDGGSRKFISGLSSKLDISYSVLVALRLAFGRQLVLPPPLSICAFWGQFQIQVGFYYKGLSILDDKFSPEKCNSI